MTEKKFKEQLLGPFEASIPADAGNAVHDASFDHDLAVTNSDETFTYTNGDGNTWMISQRVIEAIRAVCPDYGIGQAEVPRLLTEDDLGVPGVQMSMRADYLAPTRCTELKTSKKINVLKYVESAQRLAYLVSYEVPLRLILAQVKITHPRGRPPGVVGRIDLEHCTFREIEPDPTDLGRLQVLIERCLSYLRTDAAMIDHVQQKKPPVLL